MEEIEKTCENCKYEDEDMEGTHCRHCIHNAEEQFKPKDVVLTEQEIRAKAIDEFAERLKAESFSGYVTLEDYCEDTIESVAVEDIVRIAEQMKG